MKPDLSFEFAAAVILAGVILAFANPSPASHGAAGTSASSLAGATP